MYKYKAINDMGEFIEGESHLSSVKLVEADLIKQQYVPISIVSIHKNKKVSSIFKSRKTFEAQLFFENIYDYLDSGLSIDKALEIEVSSSKHISDAGFLAEILDKVRQGGTISEAMRDFPEQFNELYCGVVYVGEETDSISESFDLLAKMTHDLQEFKQKIKSALVYPLILSSVMLLSIMVLFGLVIPRFKSLFVGMGIEMSGVTAVVVGISDILTGYFEIILVLSLVLIFLFRKLFVAVKTKKEWGKYFLKVPLIGEMIRQYNLYVISMILHILMKKKITFIRALDHVRNSVENIVYKQEIDIMIREIGRGKSIQGVLNPEFFTQHFIYIVGVGEETGNLAGSFNKLAGYYYKQLDMRIKAMMTYAEPAIIMMLGLIVGLIVVSMLQAILSINELAV